MPTYDYECDKCKHKFEAFQLMTAKLLKKCPKCGGKITRLLGAGGGVIFKGSGFYQTDYKNPSIKSRDSVPREARDKNSPRGDDKPCDKPKSEGCKSCPMANKEKKDR
ncbi:MAG: zinc ribbon domain-containing protein [Candidatus Omnitrophota bacterium]|nr:zinc ribbon domain-containing protein [Candidatus Omnitrophota bacterium]